MADFDSIGTGINTNANGTIQSTHSINASSNGILLALFNSSGVGTAIINSSPKFAGQSLTKLISGTDVGNSQVGELWYLVAPPAGLGTLAGTWSSASVGQKTVISMAYNGINQSSPIPGSSFFIGTSVASGSITRTIVANNLFVGGMQVNDTIGTVAIGNRRGTVINNDLSMGADNTQGTLRFTFPGGDDTVMLGAELSSIGSIAFDSSAGSAVNAAGGTLLWKHTIVSSTNGILIAQLGWQGTNNVTSLKFAGTALTKVIAGTEGLGASDIEIWYLLNPPTGLGTFNGTWSAATGARGATSIALTGVDQTTPIGGSAIALGTLLSVGTVSLATTVDTSWLVGGIVIPDSGGTAVLTTGQVDRVRGTVSGFYANILDTNGPISPTATGSLTFNTALNQNSSLAAIEVRPAPAAAGGGATNTTFKTLLGGGNT